MKSVKLKLLSNEKAFVSSPLARAHDGQTTVSCPQHSEGETILSVAVEALLQWQWIEIDAPY